MEKAPTLYGRFDFPAIDVFVDRLKQVSQHFFDHTAFTAYMITYNRGSFYGLEYEELKLAFDRHRGNIKTLAASCNQTHGLSVSLNVRFNQDSEIGEGQYFVLAPSYFVSNQIVQMINGLWEPPSEEELKRQAELIAQAEQEAAAAKKEAERQAQLRNQPIETLSDSFRFDEQVSIGTLKELTDFLSKTYLQSEAFTIRAITRDGNLLTQLDWKQLDSIFQRNRNALQKLILTVRTEDQQMVDISLSFGPQARRRNLELELTIRQARKVRSLIREYLEQPVVEYEAPQAAMIHEMFSFDQQQFSLRKTIELVQRISQRYFHGEQPSAFLSTESGENFPAVRMNQLPGMFTERRASVNFLLFGMNHIVSSQTFSLMFQFRGDGQDPYGSLSIIGGDQQTHADISRLIWVQLGLRGYQHHRPPVDTTVASPETHLLVEPIYQGRAVETEPHVALIIMPLEAYWSESLWLHMRDTLQAMGWDSVRAEGLFTENTLESNWTAINKAQHIIVDLTYKHPDVFYKLGSIHTIGKQVVLISQHARDIPADFRKFPHIVYDNNIYGLQRLSERLIEILKTHTTS